MDLDPDKDRVVEMCDLSAAIALFSRMLFEHNLHHNYLQKWLVSDVTNVDIPKHLVNLQISCVQTKISSIFLYFKSTFCDGCHSEKSCKALTLSILLAFQKLFALAYTISSRF